MADNRRPSSAGNTQSLSSSDTPPSDAGTTTTTTAATTASTPRGMSTGSTMRSPQTAPFRLAIRTLRSEEEEEGERERGEEHAIGGHHVEREVQSAAVIHRPRAIRSPRRENRAQDQAGQDQSNFVLNWALTHYHYENDHNVPRSGMYQDYLATCAQRDMQPVNCATFGKLIRHIFPRITTRRLGVRGQSRYHYCGIRRRVDASPRLAHAASAPPLPVAPAQQQPAVGPPVPTAPPTRTRQQRRRAAALTSPYTTAASARHHDRQRQGSSVAPSPQSPFVSVKPQALMSPPPSSAWSSQPPPPPPVFLSLQQWRRDPTMAQLQMPSAREADARLPTFAPVQFLSLKDNPVAHEFSLAYEQHCQELLDFACSGQFEHLFAAVRAFYRMLPDRFRSLIKCVPEATEATWRWDCCLYDAIIESTLPTVYMPVAFNVLHGLNQYTRELQRCIQESLQDHYPEDFTQKKMGVAQVFVSKFRRHLKLNQMAHNVMLIFAQPSTVHTMQKDWGAIDFDSVIDQSHWLCECDTLQLKHILQFDVYSLLSTNAALERWVTWLKGIVDRFMRVPPELHPSADPSCYVFYAKQFVFKWTYYATLIAKDLSSSRARSEASFQTLREFFDDLVLYLAEERLSNVALYWEVPSTTTVPMPPARPIYMAPTATAHRHMENPFATTMTIPPSTMPFLSRQESLAMQKKPAAKAETI